MRDQRRRIAAPGAEIVIHIDDRHAVSAHLVEQPTNGRRAACQGTPHRRAVGEIEVGDQVEREQRHASRMLRAWLQSAAHSPDYFFFFLLRLRLLLEREGTLPPARLASESPMAMACLRLVTFLPVLPLRSVPRFRSRMTFSTLVCAFFPYRLAMRSSGSDAFHRPAGLWTLLAAPRHRRYVIAHV